MAHVACPAERESENTASAHGISRHRCASTRWPRRCEGRAEQQHATADGDRRASAVQRRRRGLACHRRLPHHGDGLAHSTAFIASVVRGNVHTHHDGQVGSWRASNHKRRAAVAHATDVAIGAALLICGGDGHAVAQSALRHNARHGADRLRGALARPCDENVELATAVRRTGVAHNHNPVRGCDRAAKGAAVGRGT